MWALDLANAGEFWSRRMTDQELVDRFDINDLSQDFLVDPFPTYRALRELDPLHRNQDSSYFLTRHADVQKTYKHPGMSSDKKPEYKAKFGDAALYAHHTTSLVFNDAPYHTRVRKLLAAAFTPRSLKELEPVIQGIVDNLLDGLEDRDSFDLIHDFAIPLPTEIIADMLGIPAEARPLLRDYSMNILAALDPVVSEEKLAAGNRDVEEFGALLLELITARRKNPDSGEKGEVLSALIFGEVDGEHLSDEELVQNCIFLLNAGHETTTSLTGNGIVTLLEYPDQLDRLRADPSLINTAVDEFLRFQSSVQIGNRKTTEEIDFDGVTVPAGAFLHMSIGAANRDPLVFEDPESVDISRHPNPHFAFADGKHTCLGNTLARIEGRIAIGDFIRRFPNLRQAGEPEQMGIARFRGFNHYPVAVG